MYFIYILNILLIQRINKSVSITHILTVRMAILFRVMKLLRYLSFDCTLNIPLAAHK